MFAICELVKDTGTGGTRGLGELPVLVLRQVQPYATPPDTNPRLKRLSPSWVELGSAPPGHVDDLFRELEDEAARQWSLQILFDSGILLRNTFYRSQLVPVRCRLLC